MADQKVQIVPETGYDISDVLVDGVSKGSITEYTFENIQYDHTLHAEFDLKSFTISPSASDGGRILPGGNTTVLYGGDQTFVFYPDSGYVISDVIVDGVSEGSISSYSFTDVTSNHNISVLFNST